MSRAVGFFVHCLHCLPQVELRKPCEHTPTIPPIVSCSVFDSQIVVQYTRVPKTKHFARVVQPRMPSTERLQNVGSAAEHLRSIALNDNLSFTRDFRAHIGFFKHVCAPISQRQ